MIMSVHRAGNTREDRRNRRGILQHSYLNRNKVTNLVGACWLKEKKKIQITFERQPFEFLNHRPVSGRGASLHLGMHLSVLLYREN
jgi:hypothetical protein